MTATTAEDSTQEPGAAPTPAVAPPPAGLAAIAALLGSRAQVLRSIMPVAVTLGALFLIPAMTSTYWVKVFTSVTITAIVALGAGLLYGRVGLVSLCQIALLAVGTWVTMRLGFATRLPFPILLVLAGLVTAVIGVGIGLPALRLSGLYLAMVTLMAAAGATVVLNTLKFPNGGPGFKGLVESVESRKTMRRPSWATTDYGFYRYAVIVAALMFGLAVWHLAAKPGRLCGLQQKGAEFGGCL